jgi:uncharacterized integral membrane protein (TIGR00698 family)
LTPGHVLVPLLAAVALLPFVPPAAALVTGVLVALAAGNPWLPKTRKLAQLTLGLAVLGLGAAADLGVVGRVGARGIGYTAAGIGLTFLAGLLLARLLGVEEDTALLVTTGTAICGGSAIAAVAPVIKAKSESISVALATVFLLNAVALVVFPPLGHLAGLDEARFGLFAALAIHDTSSVVGAATAYGPKAVEVATTVKLVRALWIVPVALVIGWARARRTGERGASAAKLPWFIVGFVVMAALVTWMPALRPAGLVVAAGAKRLLVMTLFLIGTSLTRDAVRSVGLKPVALGIALWVLAAGSTLAALEAGWIS